ncbi:MAG: hexose transporter hxt1 [Cirrosporium novae-zelandiae]|nr:MAG: hexose transporter hxt1 [Cirrosporium novae-zelandiae]
MALDNSTPASPDAEKAEITGYDDSPIKYLTWRTFVLGIIASMGGFIFGYNTGQISGFETMSDFKRRFAEYDEATGEYAFSDVRSGLIVALICIGTMIGALAAAPIADKMGRKFSIAFWSVINVVGIVIQIATTDAWYQVAIGRLVAGLGVGALSSLVPMYQSESSPRQVRGAMVSAFQLFIAFGIFVSYLINYGTKGIDSAASWRIVMGVGFIWPFVLGVGILTLPESPRYAYRCGRVEEARSVLAALYGVSENHRVIAEELQDMEEKLQIERKAGKAGLLEIFTGPRMLYRTILGMTIQALQQLSGANFIFYYGNSIFQSTGISDSYVTQIILGGVNFGITFLGLYIVEHYGRRASLIGGALWMFVCFLVFASVGHFALDRDDPSNTPGAGDVLIVFTCLFICGFATTWGPIAWAITSEMYPARYRATCNGLATASNWLWNFLISFFTPFILSAIDYRFGYVFCACCFAAALIVYFFVCETKGRTLEEIDTMYIMHVKPWKSQEWVMPARAEADFGADKEHAEAAETEKTVQATL